MRLNCKRSVVLGLAAAVYCLGIFFVIWHLTLAALTPGPSPEEGGGLDPEVEVARQVNVRGAILDRNGEPLAYTQAVTVPPAEDAAEEEEPEIVYQRIYPYPDSTGVLLGYYRDSAEDQSHGLEARLDGVLTLGSRIEENRLNRQGNSVKLTLDIQLQEGITRLLAESGYGQAGVAGTEITAVVQDVNSGAILACAVWPGYDPNLYISDGSYRAQVNSGEFGAHVLSDPAYLYPRALGSVLKPLSSVAIIRSGLEKEKFYDPDYITVDGHNISTTAPQHRDIGLPEALQYSSNCYFASKILAVGREAYLATAEEFQLGGEGREWRCDFATLTSTWQAESILDLAQIAFGQGRSALSPIQLNAIIAAVATGKFYQPYLIQSQIRPNGKEVEITQPQLLSQPVSRRAQNLIGEGMLLAADRYGLNSQERGFLIAAKTGTAEAFKTVSGQVLTVPGSSLPLTDPDNGQPMCLQELVETTNATMTGYFPADQGREPQYALTLCAPASGCSGVSLAELYSQIANAVQYRDMSE